jgi:hypothetical protein
MKLFLCAFFISLTLSAAVPPEALSFDANMVFTNFSLEDEEKVKKAIEVIKKVVGSEEFRDRVLNFSFNGDLGFVDNGGYTNEQIYRKILNGAEVLKPENNHKMDLDLELYFEEINTIGYTYPNVLKIWMNTKYFSTFTASQVADNIFHEWMHKLGFDHAIDYSVSRDYTVPYGLGYLVKELGKKYE